MVHIGRFSFPEKKSNHISKQKSLLIMCYIQYRYAMRKAFERCRKRIALEGTSIENRTEHVSKI